MRLPPAGCVVYFWEFFLVKSLKTLSFVRFSSTRRCFVFCPYFLVLLFWLRFFAKLSQIPSVSSLVFDDFGGVVAKFLFGKLQKLEVFAWSTFQK